MVDSSKNLKMQKNRINRKPKNFILKFGQFGMVTLNQGRIELIHLTVLKKLIKKFIRKKKSEVDQTREKIWYFGRPNYYIQKKSKNSRMGKGKGLIERKIIKVRRGFILFEFLGVPYLKLTKLVKKVNKILDVKFCILIKKIEYHPL